MEQKQKVTADDILNRLWRKFGDGEICDWCGNGSLFRRGDVKHHPRCPVPLIMQFIEKGKKS
jgi:hypothetical protein